MESWAWPTSSLARSTDPQRVPLTTAIDGSPLLDVDVDLGQHLDDLVLDESDDEDEPVLRWKDGRLVDTWREGYPYDERMPRPEYEVVKRQLQIELLRLQNWVKDYGRRIVILLKAETPRARAAPSNGSPSTSNQGGDVVALEKPSAARAGSVVLPAVRQHLPSAGRWCSSTGPGTTGPGWSG